MTSIPNTARLDSITAIHEASVRLLVAHANGASNASVYEEADGLDTVCVIPGYYGAANQDFLADGIAEMWEHREYLLDLARKQSAALAAALALAEEWRYKGEHGWGAWQEGHGPDQEGYALDGASADLRTAIGDALGDDK